MYKAIATITLRPSILDPQGRATQRALHDLGATTVESVRIGKSIEMMIDAATEAEARQVAVNACQRLLANSVMEDYRISVEAQPAVRS
jgi:phosphoribosylformylglycinamidine synthase subunit PurS